ncbi:MAG: helix-turn-helix transcriptional regulator [Pseudomonadota bacterium]
MTRSTPRAYCFFQELAPRLPLDTAFDRDYLLYAAKGALRVSVGSEHWVLPPSFAAWVPAGTQIIVTINTPVTTCSVLTVPGFCDGLPDSPTVFQMSPMARQMIHYCRDWSDDANQPPQAEPFFMALLNVCAVLVDYSVNVKRPTATDPAVQRAIDITEAGLATAVVAGDVARQVNMSERSLQRRFRDNVGLSWSEALTQLRMIRAVELLAIGDLSVVQIAGDVGFNSLSAFNRAFRRFAECTPTEFRKALRS